MDVPDVDAICDRGSEHLTKNEWGEADELFKQALAADPKSKCALLGRARILRCSKFEYEQARRLINRCLYHHPNDPDALAEQGWIEADQQDHERALAAFDRALATDAANREALRGRIRSLVALKRAAEAREAAESAAAKLSRQSWLVNELALALVALGDFDAAVEAFLEAGGPKALYDALLKQDSRDAKDAFATAILARQGEDREALRAVATAHAIWDDGSAAVDAIRQVLMAAPADEDEHLRLIDLLLSQERYPEAEAACDDAVSALGRSTDALLGRRAALLFQTGKRDYAIEALAAIADEDLLLHVLEHTADADALEAFEALFERRPADTQVLKIAASRHANARGEPRALELLDRALGIDPRDIDALASKGEILLKQRRIDELEALLEHAHKLFGADRPEIVSLRVRLLIERQFYDQAVRVAVEADRAEDIAERVQEMIYIGDVATAERLVGAAVAEYPDSTAFLGARGRLLVGQRSFDDAEKVWNAMWEREPDNVDHLLQRLFALRSARRFGEAERAIEEGMHRVSRKDECFLLGERGMVMWAQGRTEEAVRAFDEALTIRPDYGFAHLWKVRTLRETGRREEADSAIRAALAPERSGSYRAEILCELGQLHEARQDWKAAVAAYADARRENDSPIDAHFRAAAVLLRLRRNDDAEQLIKELVNQRGDENEVLEKAGWYYLSKKDFTRASEHFESVLRRAPAEFSAINGLGGLHFEQGKYELAELQFRRSLDIAPGDPVLWNNLGWAIVRQIDALGNDRDARLLDAERCCQKAIELWPGYPNAHACLGIIAFKRGRLMESEDLLKHAAELDPTDANYSDLGALYAHLGRFDEARKVLERGCEQNRYDAPVRIELGNVLLQTNQPKQAISVLREACAINPLAPEPVRALAIALARSGELIEALHVLRRGIQSQEPARAAPLRIVMSRVLTDLADKTDDPALHVEALKESRLAIAAQPNSADAFFQAGIACFRQNDHRAALRHFRQCMALDTGNFEAERNVHKLESVRWQDIGRTRIGLWAGTALGVVCFALLLVLWAIYLQQPLPATKDAIRQIDSATLLTLSPILLALVFVAFLLPWLSRLKLPGVEAELALPKEQISAGPSGPLTIGTGSPTISTLAK